MAKSRITCPDCRTVLRPAKPVADGKKVRCPECGNVFTTPGLVEDEEEARPRRKAASQNKDRAAIKKAESAPPPSTPAGDDNDDGDAIYKFVEQGSEETQEKPDINYAPDMSIKDLRGPAQAAVVQPSNYLILIGSLCCLSDIFIICWSFWPMVFSETIVNWQRELEAHFKEEAKKDTENNPPPNNPGGAPQAPRQSKANQDLERIKGYKEWKDVPDKDREIIEKMDDEQRIWRRVNIGVFILLFIYNGVAIVGAVKMQNLESRTWGIVSSVMTLLPMGAAGLGCFLGGGFFYSVGDWIMDERSGWAQGDWPFYTTILGVLPYLLAIFVGYWSLKTLFNKDVIAGFEYVAE